MNEMSHIAKMKELRKKNNLTQRQLAKEIGVSHGFYSDVERGVKGMSGSLAIKLADRFNTPVDYWLDIETTAIKLSKESPFKQTIEGLEQLVDEGLLTNVEDLDNPDIANIIIDFIKLDLRKKKIRNLMKNSNDPQQ